MENKTTIDSKNLILMIQTIAEGIGTKDVDKMCQVIEEQELSLDITEFLNMMLN